MSSLPLLCFPTNTVLLDDESSFVEHVEVAIENEVPQLKSFTDPKKALAFVRQTGILNLNQEPWIRPREEQEAEEYTLSVQVQSLRNKMQDPDRSQVTTCLIVDYQMGNMNGIDWCRQVTNPLIKKILLTGVADEHVGIEAMNNSWIHQYVRKQDPQMVEKLIAATNRAKLHSFADLTQGLLFTMTQCAEDTALLDPKFIDFFLNYIHSNQIVEFYLIEAMGSFLMVDKDGKQHCLFVQTRAKAESNLQLLDEWIADPKIRFHLETCRKIICCPAPHNFVTPRGVNYEPYLFPAQKLEGQHRFITGP